MGLDFVELIISIEDAFDIAIEDEEAVNIVTVGDCHKFILKKIGNRDENKCLTVHTFNRLRKVFTEELGIERNKFHPGTSLDDLIPKSNRRKLWRRISQKFKLKIPLSIPDWLAYMLIALIPIIILSGFIGSNAGLLPSYSGWISIPIALLIFRMSSKLTEPLAYKTNLNENTVGGLTKEVLALNFGTVSKEVKSWNGDEVWEAMKNIIVSELGVKPEEVVSSAEFIKDLGAD